MIASSSSEESSPERISFVYPWLQFDHHFKAEGYEITERVYPKSDPETETLLTWGWSLRERLLSTRLTEYRDEEVTWECREDQRRRVANEPHMDSQ
jgi:hypothetical protein